MTTMTCTVGPRAVTGERCGKPAVYVFKTADGETFAECADHYPGFPLGTVGGHYIGEPVVVRRHGKTYMGRVVKVGARGAVYAEVTYGNGATRTVKI